MVGKGSNRRARWARALPLTFLLGGTQLAPAHGQSTEVEVQAGAHYRAGGFQRWLLGSNYRELWTMPIRVPILDPDTFAGGLRLLQEGGGMQTRSLRFQGRDGVQYVFRSVDKEETELPNDLRRTWISEIIQDQISAKHPAGALVAAPLLEAAGVVHVTPVLAIMGSSPVLGAFGDEFIGMLGMMEIRPEDPDDGGRFGDYPRIIGTDRLLERIEESPRDRVDAQAYLRARLMDLLLGDWDRHQDQWRWAQEDRGEIRYWLPIPRDRDNAFFDSRGTIATLGRAWRPFIVRFEPDYHDLYGLIYNAQLVDRPILAGVTRPEWIAIANDLRERLSDEVIAGAVAAMPPEYQEGNGPVLEAKLRARRDAIPVAAERFYGWIVGEAEVRATDADDWLLVDHADDGSVRVRLGTGAMEADPYYDRIFDPAETREIRIHLQEGADRVRIQGSGRSPILLRVLGGGGNDQLEDRSTGRSRTLFYDGRGESRHLGGGTSLVPDEDRPARPDSVLFRNEPPRRDWGRTFSRWAPAADWESEIGPVLAMGPRWTAYGFRREPFASQEVVRVEYAPFRTRFGVSGEARRIWTGNRGETFFGARATQLSLVRFHGYGNETPEGPDSERFRIWSNELSLRLTFERFFGRGFSLGAGPELALFDPSAREDAPANLFQVPGSRSFGVAGVHAGFGYDRRDSEEYPRRGVFLRMTGSGFPAIWGDAPEAFLRLGSVATGYLPLPFPLESTLAVRAGGERVWGDAPVQYEAHVGGSSSIRGYRHDRFTGDASLHGTAEVRTRLMNADLQLVRGDLGTLFFLDTGRVFWHDEDSSRWHSGWGGGLWFGPLDRRYLVRLVYAQGERRTLSAGFGVPF